MHDVANSNNGILYYSKYGQQNLSKLLCKKNILEIASENTVHYAADELSVSIDTLITSKKKLLPR